MWDRRLFPEVNDGKIQWTHRVLCLARIGYDFPMPLSQLFSEHPRIWRSFQYVYPVLSRRSRGLSIGVNVNIDKVCNFDCVYCCVDRADEPTRADVDLEQLARELETMLAMVADGSIWEQPPFDRVEGDYRRANDIAFSGDGEPTMYARLDEAVELAARAKAAAGLRTLKLVLVTNATGLDRQPAQRALRIMDRNHGEIWAKLDAGTQNYYQRIDRSRFPLAKVLRNIRDCGQQRAIVIQSLFMAINGQSVPDSEFESYLDRLAKLRDDGCHIRLVQLYTVARRTAELSVEPLPNEHLDRLGQRLRQRLPDLACEVFHGVK